MKLWSKILTYRKPKLHLVPKFCQPLQRIFCCQNSEYIWNIKGMEIYRNIVSTYYYHDPTCRAQLSKTEFCKRLQCCHKNSAESNDNVSLDFLCIFWRVWAISYKQSYVIKSAPWTILWFRILGIFSVENMKRLCVFMFQTWDNSQLCTDSQYSSQ